MILSIFENSSGKLASEGSSFIFNEFAIVWTSSEAKSILSVRIMQDYPCLA